MSTRKHAPPAAQTGSDEAAPKAVRVDPVHAAHEHRKRHIVLWVASLGTMAFIVALWIMILPSQLAGYQGFGVKDAATWFSRPREVDANASQQSFSDIMDNIRQGLNTFEEAQRAKYAQEDAISTETALLKARIEAAGSDVNAPATNAAADANAATNAPPPGQNH